MNIAWSSVARSDLLAIFDYILQDNPRAAGEVLDRIDEAVLRLADHPGAGRPGRVAETRELVIADLPYGVPYQVQGDRVFILRVLHTARKWPEQL